MLEAAAQDGFELGLHSNFVEFAKLHNQSASKILKAETKLLSTFWDIRGLATHRDINYTYNSLPWVEVNPETLESLGFKYQAYDKRFFENAVYVNEGLNPHLCWRNHRPEDVIKTGKSIYMLTHSHWWWVKHPFEAHT
jgi:hypothetical protein